MFKAQMAIGSWAGTPFMLNLDMPTSIIADVMSRGQFKLGKVKGKEQAIEMSGSEWLLIHCHIV